MPSLVRVGPSGRNLPQQPATGRDHSVAASSVDSVAWRGPLLAKTPPRGRGTLRQEGATVLCEELLLVGKTDGLGLPLPSLLGAQMRLGNWVKMSDLNRALGRAEMQCIVLACRVKSGDKCLQGTLAAITKQASKEEPWAGFAIEVRSGSLTPKLAQRLTEGSPDCLQLLKHPVVQDSTAFFVGAEVDAVHYAYIKQGGRRSPCGLYVVLAFRASPKSALAQADPSRDPRLLSSSRVGRRQARRARSRLLRSCLLRSLCTATGCSQHERQQQCCLSPVS